MKYSLSLWNIFQMMFCYTFKPITKKFTSTVLFSQCQIYNTHIQSIVTVL